MTRERRDAWRGVGATAAYGAVGFFLYLLVTGLGFGKRDAGGRDARPTVPPIVPPAPPMPPMPPMPPIPPMPQDEKRLVFVMTAPTIDDPSRSMSFRLRGDFYGRVYSLEEMIARVKAGRRFDVTLMIAGDVRHGSAESALTLLKQAGIEVWKELPSGAVTRVSGNDRGQYGERGERGERWNVSRWSIP